MSGALSAIVIRYGQEPERELVLVPVFVKAGGRGVWGMGKQWVGQTRGLGGQHPWHGHRLLPAQPHRTRTARKARARGHQEPLSSCAVERCLPNSVGLHCTPRAPWWGDAKAAMLGCPGALRCRCVFEPTPCPSLRPELVLSARLWSERSVHCAQAPRARHRAAGMGGCCRCRAAAFGGHTVGAGLGAKSLALHMRGSLGEEPPKTARAAG